MLILSSNLLLSISYDWDTTAAPNGGAWANSANWIPSSGFPVSGDSATITKATSSATSFDVTLSSQSATNLILSSSNAGSQTLNLIAGAFTLPSTGILAVTAGSADSLTVLFSNSFVIQPFSSATFNISDNCTLNLSSLSGTGSVFNKIGNGILNISSLSVSTFATATISAGTLGFYANPGNGGSIINNGTLVFGAEGVYISSISGSGAVIKEGSGEMALFGGCSYSGTTTISGGTLTFVVDMASLGGNIINNSTLRLSQGSSNSYAGVISGTGGVLKSGSGPTVFSGNNTYSGVTNISVGSLTLSGDITLLGGNITNNGSLTLDQSVSRTFTKLISGTGTLTKSGAGTLTLTQANDYTGATTLSAGGIILSGSSSTLGNNSSLEINGGNFVIATGAGNKSIGSLSGNGGTTLNLNANTLTISQSNNGTYSGVISGSGGLTKTGGANLNLAGDNTYSGATIISNGTLTLSGDITLLSSDITDNANLVLNQSVSRTFTKLISGTGTLTKSGAGTLTLTQANDYTGATTISAGGITLSGSGSTLGNNSSLAINGGSFVIATGAGNKAVGSLSGSSGTINLNANSLTVSQSTDGFYGGTISGSGDFIKQGDATLSLNNDYSGYTGEITVSAGTLVIGESVNFVNASAFVLNGTLNDGSPTGSNTQREDTIPNLSGSGTFVISNGFNNYIEDFFFIYQISQHIVNLQNSIDTTYSGSFSNSGGFDPEADLINSYILINKTGAAALTLSGSEINLNYSYVPGYIEIDDGTLIFSGDTSSFVFNQLTNSSALIFDQSSDSSFNITIAGSGTLEKLGTGVLTLSSGNSYTGTTTISAGGITLSGGGTIGDVTAPLSMSGGTLTLSTGIGSRTIGGLSGTGGTIALNDNTLVVAQGVNGTFAGMIGGSGGVTKTSSGTLTLTGANNYTGTTTISAGRITLSGGSSALGNNSSLVLNGGNMGILTGAGSKSIGSLTGTSGTITLNNNTLTINQFSDGSFNGDFVGTSSANLVKEGAGILTLTGISSSFVGDTTVNAGTLSVNGSLNGTTSVSANGRLQGIGTLNVLINSGTVAPGNSIGTLTVAGDFTMTNPSAILEIELNRDGTCDLLQVTGHSTLTGLIQAFPEPGVYLQGTEFLILTSNGGITGNFISVMENHPQDFEILKVGNNIYIIVDPAPFIISPFGDLLTGNAKLTYDYIFSMINPNDTNLLALQNTLLDLTSLPALSDVCVQLCPALYSALSLLELQNNVHIAQMMTQKNRDYLCNCYCKNDERKSGFPQASFWVQPLGFYYNQKGVQEQYGFHDYTYGTVFGFLMPIDWKLFANVGLGCTHSNLKWNNNYGHSSSTTIYLTPMIGYSTEKLFMSFLLQGDVDFYKIKRNISFTGLQEQATHQHKSYNILCGLDGSVKIKISRLLRLNYTPLSYDEVNHLPCAKGDFEFFIQPEFQFYYLNCYQGSFIERGAGYVNLSVNRKHNAFFQPNIGIKLIQEITTSDFCFAPNLYLGYLTNINLSNSRYTSSLYQLDLALPNFYVNGFDRTVNQVVMGAEFVMRQGNHFLFTCGYNATMLSHMFTQTVNIRFSVEF